MKYRTETKGKSIRENVKVEKRGGGNLPQTQLNTNSIAYGTVVYGNNIILNNIKRKCAGDVRTLNAIDRERSVSPPRKQIGGNNDNIITFFFYTRYTYT